MNSYRSPHRHSFERNIFLFEDKDKTKEQLINDLVEMGQWITGSKASEAQLKRAEKWYGTPITSPRHTDSRRIIPILDSKKLLFCKQREMCREEKGGF